MKRLLLVLVLCLLALGVVAAPALAYYAPKAHTAYVSIFDKSGWGEWAGPSDPGKMIVHTGPIPHDWNVVVRSTWLDSETCARLAPIVFQRTFSFSKVNGTLSEKVLNSQRAVRFWSPVYVFDAVNYPGGYARDWWLPMGKLAKGEYRGWVKEQVVSDYPTCMDPDGAIVTDPIWSAKYTHKFPRTFAVK